MNRRELLLDLHRHMEWADAQVWAAVLAHPAAAADQELRRLLHHIHLVQQVFFAIWRGEPADVHAGEELDTPALAVWAGRYYPAARAWLSSASAGSFDAQVSLPWAASTVDRLGFVPGQTTMAETVLQVAIHTAHHRGQVAARLRALGGEPPLVDYVAWLWRGRPPAAWP